MKPFDFETKQAARGRAKVCIVDAKTGKEVWESPWQSNLILDCGLDYISDTFWARCLDYCTAGTSNTPTKDICDGTYSQAAGTVTRDTGTRDFISGDVGKLIRFADGTERKITAFTDATHVTVTPTGTVASQGILIYRVNQIHLGSHTAYNTSYPEFSWDDGEKSQYTFWDFLTATTTFRRTYDFPEEVGLVNYTEIGFSPAPVVGISGATSNSTTFNFSVSNHGLTVGKTIKISGMTPSAYNGTFVVATVPNNSVFTVTNAANPGNSTVNGILQAPLFSRILLAGAVTPGAGQLLRVKYELRVKLTGGLASEAPTVDGGITGWPRPYVNAGITNSGSAWTLTLAESHHYVAGGKINIRNATRPKVAITAATSDASTMTITAVGHGRSPGDVVLIEGMTPTGYNGRFTVATAPDADTITITSLLNPGTGTVFGTIRQQEPRGTVITAAASSATALSITAVGHGLTAGDRVVIKGMTPDGYNGNYLVDAVADADHFTVLSTANPGTGTAFGDCYKQSLNTWYDGEWTVASVTSTTVVITNTATPPVAGAGGTTKNNTKRVFRMCGGMGVQQIAYTGYANNPLANMNQLAGGAATQTGAGFLEGMLNTGSGVNGVQTWLAMQAASITVPPTGFPRNWGGTGAGSPGNLANESGLSNIPALPDLVSSNRAAAGPDAYTPGSFSRNTKITFGAGIGNRNDIRMITIHCGALSSGATNLTFHGLSGYILFEERQRKDATHKLEFNIGRTWNRDLTVEAS